ncbi:hypothetical protein L810_8865 [Burkholderia sp. AU4i]|nr:hypothetical protein L810_8865 [Burkholderia sp. AU4i]
MNRHDRRGSLPRGWCRARARRRLPARCRMPTPPGARSSSYAGRASLAATLRPDVRG